jgi:hypothetical protein
MHAVGRARARCTLTALGMRRVLFISSQTTAFHRRQRQNVPWNPSALGLQSPSNHQTAPVWMAKHAFLCRAWAQSPFAPAYHRMPPHTTTYHHIPPQARQRRPKNNRRPSQERRLPPPPTLQQARPPRAPSAGPVRSGAAQAQSANRRRPPAARLDDRLNRLGGNHPRGGHGSGPGPCTICRSRPAAAPYVVDVHSQSS